LVSTIKEAKIGFKESLKRLTNLGEDRKRLERGSYSATNGFSLPLLLRSLKEEEEEVFRSIPGIIRLIERHRFSLEKLDGWWPSYFGDPEKILPSLLSIFLKLRKNFSNPKPIFLDCGCQDGVVMILASCAGFTSLGIELNQEFAGIAQEMNAQAFKKGIAPTKGEVACGSYYLPQFFGSLSQMAVVELRDYFDKYGRAFTDSFDEYANFLLSSNSPAISFEEKLSFLLGQSGPNPYDELGLLRETPEGLVLGVDLAYCYPADLFFDRLFPQQLKMVQTQPEFLLAVLEASRDLKSKGALFERDLFTIQSTLPFETKLSVFGLHP